MPATAKRLPVLRSQAEMVAYDQHWGAARGGTRAGKSFGFALWLFFKRIQKYPLANHVVVGADYQQLRNGYFDLFDGFLRSIGWREEVDYRYREHPTPRIDFLRFGKRVRLRSLSTRLVERIRGMSIQTLLLEEPQTWGTANRSGEDLFAILVGRLSHSQESAELYPDMQVQGRMSFNPPSEGTWLYELIENRWPDKGYRCWRMPVADNYLLLNRESYIEGLKVALHPRRWPAELEGHWSTGGGNTYYGYDSAIHTKAPEGLPPVDAVDLTQPLLWTHDFNVNLMCSVIAQPFDQVKTLKPGIRFLKLDQPRDEQFDIAVPTWQPKILRVLGEFALEDSSSSQVVDAFVASKWYPIAKKVGVELYGDPSGNARSQTARAGSGMRTNWEIIQNGLKAAGIDVKMRIALADPGVTNRVNMVNGQFLSKAGPGVTVNVAECPTLIRDWREMKWRPNGRELDKSNASLSHASDAWAYLVHFRRSQNFVLSESILNA